VVQELAGVVGIRPDALLPVAIAGVDGGVEHVAEVAGQRREIAGRDVERNGVDTRAGEQLPLTRLPEARDAPDLVARRERARDRKADLASGARDEDLLAFEHIDLPSHAPRPVAPTC
jgi:hypothetical protein